MKIRTLVALSMVSWACEGSSADGSVSDTVDAADNDALSDTVGDTADTNDNDTVGDTVDTNVSDAVGDTADTNVSDAVGDTADTNANDAVGDTADTNVSDVTVDTSPLGGSRPARVVLPADYDPAVAHPLVFLLHGYSATGQIQDLYLDFSPRAVARGFIAVVPDGTTNLGGQQFWNASPGWCCDFGGSGVDDAGYLVGLVAEAKARFHVDPARVYLVGHSNGGFMSYKLACEHADTFAAIVSIAGAMPLAANDCQPSEPVAVLQVHGTFDTVITYAGTPGQYPSATTAVERWAGHNGCASTTSTAQAMDYDSTVFGAETSRLTHPDCDAGAAVLWRMNGSAHVPTFTPAFVPAVLDWLLAHPKAR